MDGQQKEQVQQAIDDGDAGRDQEAGQEEPQKPLSKNQQKKLLKQQRYEEQKRLRKEKEKEEKLAKQEQRRVEGLERAVNMTEEEKARWRAEKRAKVDARKQEGEARKAKLRQAKEDGQRVVIDLDFEDKMHEAEIKSLCQQLAYVYGDNSRAVQPCHLILTSAKGRMLEHMQRQLGSGFDRWLVTRTEDDYMAHFKGREGELVYLTADSPNELHELDPSKAYIIGGLVDRNRYKGICLNKAEEQGIATGRLPLGELQLASSQVMTTNHVVGIMLRWLELRDWVAAFNAVIPSRKRKQEGGEGEQQQQQKQQQQGGVGSSTADAGEEPPSRRAAAEGEGGQPAVARAAAKGEAEEAEQASMAAAVAEPAVHGATATEEKS